MSEQVEMDGLEQVAEAAQRVVDGNQPVVEGGGSVDDREVTLQNLQQKLEEAERYKEASQRLLNGEGEPTGDWEKDFRLVTKMSGWEQSEIEAYVERYRRDWYQQDQEMGDDPVETGEGAGGQVVKDDGLSEAVIQEIESLKREREEGYRRELRRNYQESLDRARNVGDVQDLLKAVERVQGEKGVEKVKDRLRGRIGDQIAKLAEKKLQASGSNRYDPEWLGEFAGQAAKSVVEDYRSVIGDVSRLGASPETVGGSGRVVKVERPEPLSHLVAGRPQDLEQSVKDYATKTLLADLAEWSPGKPGGKA
jgi:hypothetical protein